MAKHGIRANRRREKPKATIQAAPTVYKITKPVGSAERFLDDAAKEALVAAAAGGLPTPRQFVPGAVRAVAKEAERYPDSLLREAAKLPQDELTRRAAVAEGYRKAMEAQNAVVDTVAAATSPVGNMVANQAGATAHDAMTRQDWGGGSAMLASMIGHIGNSRLPEGKRFALSRLVPDRKDSPEGAYFKTPPLRKGWKEALAGGKATLRQLLDLSEDEHGRILSMAYPDIGDLPVVLVSESQGQVYIPKTKVAAKDFTYEVNGKKLMGRTSPSVIPEQVELIREGIDADKVWSGLIHEALTHAIAEREGWSPDFKGTNVEAQGGNYDKYLRQAGERLAQAHVLYETMPEMRAYSFPELVESLNGDRGADPGTRSPPLATEATESHEDLREEAPPPRQDAKGGRSARTAEGAGETEGTPGTTVSETPVSEAPVQQGGPRIVINPTTFHNRKDALCVAFNEGFRVWMEANGFEPQSEPTDAQRKFFSDTAYADDEVQLRRTILARIATFDTSVKDPTDDQLSETASFLGAVLESGWCKNEWERDSVSRLMNAVQAAVGAEPVEPRQEPLEAREAEPLQRHAAMGGGETDDEEEKKPVQTEQSGNDAESGSGETAHYNEDGSYAGSDMADGTSTAASGSGEIARYGADGTYLGSTMVDGSEKAPVPDGQGQTAGGQESPQQPQPEQASAQQASAQQANAQQAQPEQAGTQQPEQGSQDDGRLRAGIDRSQFGKDGHIGIGARIVDPVTGKSRSSLSMNGPAIKPARAIGDMGSRSLTDSKSMNGPSIQPNRAIGDMGSTELTDPASMNGPSIQPVQQIGDMGSRSLTDTKSMNGPALKPRRRIGDMGGRTLANNRRRR